MTDKPAPQKLSVGGIDAHGAMGAAGQEQPPTIPQEVIDEGVRQVEAGAAFFNKKLSDCTREELYAAIVLAWHNAMQVDRDMSDILNTLDDVVKKGRRNAS